jgi:23S rRNA (guanine2445-N2)-methyltransferase / 23S rRNA (guanine2069-N7)-methyltransferase
MTKAQPYSFFASCPQEIEPLLEQECQNLGINSTKINPRGVSFEGSLEMAYELCLWSRVAQRVFVWLHHWEVSDLDSLYAGVQKVDWPKQMGLASTLAVDVTLRQSTFEHTHYARLRVKDSIVDQFRELKGERPDVDSENPDVLVRVDVHRQLAKVGIDLSGHGLHQRGYRIKQGRAPIKENVAAAILMRTGWNELAQSLNTLYDPMCGSGTFLIEGAWMLGDVAPGLLRSELGSPGWLGHQAELWDGAIARAHKRRKVGLPKLKNYRFIGHDSDTHAVQAARANAQEAGLSSCVEIKTIDLHKTLGTAPPGPGLLVTNPPYGERLNSTAQLQILYRQLGRHLKEDLPRWKASILTGNPDLAKTIGLKPHRRNVLMNGKLRCNLLRFDIFPDQSEVTENIGSVQRVPHSPLDNRLMKNLRKIKPYLKRETVTAYRLYDADMPEFNVAVDVYGAAVLVQEYKAPATVEDHRAQSRFNHILDVIPQALGVEPEHLYVKTRRRQKRFDQYQAAPKTNNFMTITEGGHSFLVNLSDYVDTGIFLDHRNIRKRIAQMTSGKSFLNLFGYTGTASVYAAHGGAARSVTVDHSNTYLDWAAKNFKANRLLRHDHDLVKADCVDFLQHHKDLYDLILVDPPTFSNTKSSRYDFDLQKDHIELLGLVGKRLARGGTIIFSNHFRRFKLAEEKLVDFRVEEVTMRTIPDDFKRPRLIHQCWELTLL